MKGDFTCDNYTRPFFTLNKLLNLRIVYGIAVSLGVVSLFLICLSCESVLILDIYAKVNHRRILRRVKRILGLISGILLLCSGFLSFVVCCNYAGIITTNFYKQDRLKKASQGTLNAQVRTMYETRLIIGNGLWQGWVAGFVLMLCGLIMVLKATFVAESKYQGTKTLRSTIVEEREDDRRSRSISESNYSRPEQMENTVFTENQKSSLSQLNSYERGRYFPQNANAVNDLNYLSQDFDRKDNMRKAVKRMSIWDFD